MPGNSLIRRLVSGGWWYKLVMLVLAGLAIILSIVLQDSSHSSLELQLESRTPLFSEDVGQTGFEVSFDGQLIPNATKFAFALLNSGTRHITDVEVKEPVTISFGPSAEVFLVQLGASDPEGLALEFSETGSNDISVQFSLMNPGDFVRFCVYTSGTPSRTLAVSGRIADVKRIGFVDKSTQPIRAPRRTTVGQWCLWILAVLSWIALPSLSREVRQQTAMKKLLAHDPKYLQTALTSAQELSPFIETKLGFLSAKEKALLLKLADQGTGEVSPELLEKLRALIIGPSASKGGMYVAAILIIAGLISLILHFT